jgi:hypothetical protein
MNSSRGNGVWVLRVAWSSWLLVAGCGLPTLAHAAQFPSVFRGVVVADSPLGVRVVSVEEFSQAYLADLRPDDIIVRVHDEEFHSIDEFAVLSTALKGRATSVKVLIFRNSVPREITLHLYSYPVLREWGLEFVPDHDVRFVEPKVGLDYWVRLGRGFEDAGKPGEALNAYLNGLHNVPRDVSTALKVSVLYSQFSRRSLRDGRLPDGIARLDQSLLVMERLFDYSLTDEQLETVRDHLRNTLESLRASTAAQEIGPESTVHESHPRLQDSAATPEAPDRQGCIV